MRKDMFHVIIDRPRTGGNGGKSIPPKGTKKRLQKTPLEEAPKYESTAPNRAYGYDHKQLNEHLSPLYRYLQKQCGRPWNDVFSEICANISIASAVQSHVRDHADQYVEKNVQIVGDKVYDDRGHEVFRDFYVHPESGILCHYHRDRYRWKPKAKQYIEIDKYHHYRCIKGVWYEIELEDIPPIPRYTTDGKIPDYTYYRATFDDIVLINDEKDNHRFSRDQLRMEYGREARAIKKRQLNRKEIKKLKLWLTPLGIKARQEIEEEAKRQNKQAG